MRPGSPQFLHRRRMGTRGLAVPALVVVERRPLCVRRRDQLHNDDPGSRDGRVYRGRARDRGPLDRVGERARRDIDLDDGPDAVSASPGLTAAGTVTSTMTVVFLPGSSAPVSGMPSLSVSVSGVLSAFSRSTVLPWTPSVLVASNVSGPEMPMFLMVSV